MGSEGAKEFERWGEGGSFLEGDVVKDTHRTRRKNEPCFTTQKFQTKPKGTVQLIDKSSLQFGQEKFATHPDYRYIERTWGCISAPLRSPPHRRLLGAGDGRRRAQRQALQDAQQIAKVRRIAMGGQYRQGSLGPRLAPWDRD